jgi:hypothetical protein
MKQSLLLDGNLRAFGLREGRVEGTDPTLPKWVCDFSDVKHGRLPNISSKIGILIEDPDNFRYAAASRKFLTSPEFEDSGCVLVLRGVLVDSILTLSEASPAPTNVIAEVELGSIRAVLDNWMSIAGVADFEDGVTNSDIAAQRDKFWRIMCLNCTLTIGKRLPKDIVLDALRREEQDWMVDKIDETRGALFQRRFMATSNGMMGIAPRNARAGDTISVLDGGEVLYVLRPLDEQYYQVIEEW